MTHLIVVDIGTSSLRALLMDGQARVVKDGVARRDYAPRVTPDGGAELDPEALWCDFVSALDELLARAGGIEVQAVATSTLAHNLVGLDAEGNHLTPVYLYSDNRSAGAAEQLRATVDWSPIYARTGCALYSGYLPARLLWLRETRSDLFERVRRWVSIHEFFLLRLLGRATASHSYASWTGLLNRRTLDWDDELLERLSVPRESLSPLVSAHEPLDGIAAHFRDRWPALAKARFYPAIGDGAGANLGSGCTDATRVAVTIGTSAGVRAVLPHRADQPFPPGLWLYTVDERRALLGGSLNNGGDVYSYLRHLFEVPQRDSEQDLGALEPDAHGLTILPFFSGERCPGFRGDARAAIAGLRLDSTPILILRAALEALTYRLAAIYRLLLGVIPPPLEIVASGSALLRSLVWAQIVADVFECPVVLEGEGEASARGACLLALESMGVIRDAAELEPRPGHRLFPDPARQRVYHGAMERQNELYQVLLGDG